MRYELAKGISDCNMLVVDGDWKKQLEYGPSSFVARVCGKSIIHLDSLRLNNASPTPLVPEQLKVAHFLPLAGPELAPEQRNVAHLKERCTTLKVFISEACKLKHKSFFEQVCMLAELLESNVVPISHRYKFEIVRGDLSCIVRQLESCTCLQSANSYRWLVVKEELDASQIAAAVALNTTQHKTKLVMSVSQFVQTLGARNADVDRGNRHASC